MRPRFAFFFGTSGAGVVCALQPPNALRRRPPPAALAASAAAFAAAAGFAGLFAYTFGSDGLSRLLSTYSVTVPALVRYRWAQFLHDKLPLLLGRPPDVGARAAAFDALHARWAPAVRDCFLGTRGFYIKAGQLIACNAADAAPPLWQAVFEPLLDAVPHKPFSHVRATVERELGAPLGALFAAFDEEPFAAASIGQVHRAVLRKDGARVVVKVMYPEVEGQFRGDVRTARWFMAASLPQLVPALDEIEKQFASEFDYRREAVQLATVRANLEAGGFGGRVAVPAPHLDLCSKAVLVMDEVPAAEKLSTALRRDVEAIAASRGVTLAQLAAAAGGGGGGGGALSAAAMAARISALRWRNFFASTLTLGAVAPVHVPLNHAALLDDVFEVHGHEVLVNGFFNGDPHPGNILLSGGRLALVDYGQVKRLTGEQRLRLARLFVALARAGEGAGADEGADGGAPPPAAVARVARCAVELGYTTARNDPGVLFQLARLYFDRDDPGVTGGRHAQALLDDLEREDPYVGAPGRDDYVMVARASVMLRALGHSLGQPRSVAKMWRGLAERVMREAGEDPGAELFYPPPQGAAIGGGSGGGGAGGGDRMC
jgi:aarF domain-containing kinase